MRRFLLLSVVVGVTSAGLPALAAPPPPAFTSYVSPDLLGNSSGEPTLGIDPKTGTVLFQAGTQTLRVTNFDKRGRGSSDWADVSPEIASTTTFDPILETDEVSGRTFVSHLTLACSLMAYTDDQGGSWTEVPFGCGAGALFDHQTVGTGAFVAEGPLRPVGAYNRAVYYCAQDTTAARCATSVDGGRTFLPAATVYSTGATQCSGLFGHLKSAPEGTVYLPPTQCDKGPVSFVTPVNPLGNPGASIAVSEDNGLTWTLRRVPGSTSGNAGHPSTGVGADGTLYLAWGGREGGKRTDAGGPPMVAVSTNRGQAWTKPYQLGREFGIRNTKFVTTVAGDGDRAAVAFLGTPAAGDDQVATFQGVWRLYVSYTYDRGRTWRTYNATPESPVQVGSICTAGIFCTGNTRNLLDFNDVVIDRQGRVMAAIADGCYGPECVSNERGRKATIVRQTRGLGLLRRFDPYFRR